jgi:hypothetical protein
MSELRCGAKEKVMWGTRKGTPHERGVHNSIKINLLSYPMLGGRKSPRGREGLSDVSG